MSSRYFSAEDGSQSGKLGGEEVFTISKDLVDKVRRKRNYAEVNKSFKKKSRPWKKTDDQYPGPAPIKPKLLAKHSRGDGIQIELYRRLQPGKTSSRNLLNGMDNFF